MARVLRAIDAASVLVVSATGVGAGAFTGSSNLDAPLSLFEEALSSPPSDCLSSPSASLNASKALSLHCHHYHCCSPHLHHRHRRRRRRHRLWLTFSLFPQVTLLPFLLLVTIHNYFNFPEPFHFSRQYPPRNKWSNVILQYRAQRRELKPLVPPATA